MMHLAINTTYRVLGTQPTCRGSMPKPVVTGLKIARHSVTPLTSKAIPMATHGIKP
jgi:hypothetical protein